MVLCHFQLSSLLEEVISLEKLVQSDIASLIYTPLRVD